MPTVTWSPTANDATDDATSSPAAVVTRYSPRSSVPAIVPATKLEVPMKSATNRETGLE